MIPHAFASGPPSTRSRRARPTPALLGTAFASVVAIAVPGALAGSGCSLAVDGFVSGCQSNDDCRAKGESFAGSTCREGACRPATNPSADGADWSCLTSPPGGGVQPPGEVRVRFRFVDLESVKPIEGASFLTCGSIDTTCARPFGRRSWLTPTGRPKPASRPRRLSACPASGATFRCKRPTTSWPSTRSTLPCSKTSSKSSCSGDPARSLKPHPRSASPSTPSGPWSFSSPTIAAVDWPPT